MPTPPTRPRRSPRAKRPVQRPAGAVARPRWGMRMATALSVLVLGASGIGHAVVTGLDADIDRVDPFKDMKNRPRAGATA